jgi:hypothetical protein
MYVKLSDNPRLKQWLRRVAPSYRKHNVSVVRTNSTTIRQPYWDGGSRDSFAGADRQGGSVKLSCPHVPYPGIPGEAEIDLTTDNLAVIHGGTFCGKPATLSIHASDNFVREVFGDLVGKAG